MNPSTYLLKDAHHDPTDYIPSTDFHSDDADAKSNDGSYIWIVSSQTELK